MTENANETNVAHKAKKGAAHRLPRTAEADALLEAAKRRLAANDVLDLRTASVLSEGLRAIVGLTDLWAKWKAREIEIADLLGGRAPTLDALALRFDGLTLRVAMASAHIATAPEVDALLGLARGTTRNVLVGRVSLAGVAGGALLAWVEQQTPGGVAP